MGQAVGDALPLALGVAISPIPIIAIILMLLSARAGSNSAAFLGGWVVGVVGACAVLLALSGLLGTSASGTPSNSSSVVKLILGALVLLVAARNFRNRPKAGVEGTLPSWLEHIESVTPVKAAGLGVALSAVNPKNLLMIAGAMVAVSGYDLAVGKEIGVVAMFTVIAISTVAVPVVVYRAAGAKSQRWLDETRVWLAQNNAVVMSVLLLVIGVVLLGKGISGLSA